MNFALTENDRLDISNLKENLCVPRMSHFVVLRRCDPREEGVFELSWCLLGLRLQCVEELVRLELGVQTETVVDIDRPLHVRA